MASDGDTPSNKEFYNLGCLTGNRAWLAGVLQEDSSDSDDYNPEDHFKEILKDHLRRKAAAKNKVKRTLIKESLLLFFVYNTNTKNRLLEKSISFKLILESLNLFQPRLHIFF